MPYKIIKEYKDFNICLKITKKTFSVSKLIDPEIQRDLPIDYDLSVDYEYNIIAVPKTKKGNDLIDKATGKYRRYD